MNQRPDTELQNTELQDTELQDAERQNTERQDTELQDRAMSALESVADEWFHRQGVIAIEVATGRSEDRPVAIRVTVEDVLAPEQVPDGELFPGDVDGVPVEVVEGRVPHAGR